MMFTSIWHRSSIKQQPVSYYSAPC